MKGGKNKEMYKFKKDNYLRQVIERGDVYGNIKVLA